MVAWFFNRQKPRGSLRLPGPRAATSITGEQVQSPGGCGDPCQTFRLSQRVALRTPSFYYEGGKIIFGDEVFEIASEPEHCLLVAAKRRKLVAMLLNKDLKKRVH
jgi:hypothetical protein